MQVTQQRRRRTILIVGDMVAIFLITLFGFVTHGTIQTAGLRMMTTLLPLLISWFAVAPLLGVYDLERALKASELWRPFWAMVVCAPLAAWMRGFWLNSAIQPLFVLVLGGFASLTMLLWRLIFLAVIKLRRSPDG